MLCPNPEKRISSREIVLTIKNWDKINKIELPEECIKIKKKQIEELNLINKHNLLQDEDIKKVQEKIKNKKEGNQNLLWDFDSNHISNNSNNNDNNYNILDLEFINSPTTKKENNEDTFDFFQNNNTLNNQNNINQNLFQFNDNNIINNNNQNLNDNDIFSVPSNTVNQNNNNNNFDYGFHIDNNKQQTVSFNTKEEIKSQENTHKANSQDILSFFK